MQEINQDQIDVRMLEKETIMLAVRILEKDCGRFFNVIPLLNFFSGLYLTRENIRSCEETLDSISESISNYKRYLLNQSETLMYYLEDDYVELFNKVTIKSIFNKNLLNLDILISDYSIYNHINRYISLPKLLDRINSILCQKTFIIVDKMTTDNKAHFVPLDAHIPLKLACILGLTYPNKIGILNSFPTIEKLNAHFTLDKN